MIFKSAGKIKLWRMNIGIKTFHDQNLILSNNFIAKHCLVNCINVGGGLEEGYQLPSNALSTDYPIEAGGRNGPPGLGLMPRYNGGISDVKMFYVYCHFEVFGFDAGTELRPAVENKRMSSR